MTPTLALITTAEHDIDILTNAIPPTSSRHRAHTRRIHTARHHLHAAMAAYTTATTTTDPHEAAEAVEDTQRHLTNAYSTITTITRLATC